MSTKRTQTPKFSSRTLDLARSLSEDARIEYEGAFRRKTLAAEQLRIAEEEEKQALKDYNEAEDRYLEIKEALGDK